MTPVWFLVLVLYTGGTGRLAVTIPQYSQAVCVAMKQEELKRPEVKEAYCKKGAVPAN